MDFNSFICIGLVSHFLFIVSNIDFKYSYFVSKLHK